MGLGKDKMSEGKLNRSKIKDWSPKKQGEYAYKFYKESGQEAAHKKKFHPSDNKFKREKVIKQTMEKIYKEGLVGQIKPFMKEALRVQGM